MLRFTDRLILYCLEHPTSQETTTLHLEFKLQKYGGVQYKHTCSMD